MANKNISDMVMAQAITEYQKGKLTTVEIAAKHGIGTATLTNWAKMAGLPLRNRGRKKQATPTPRQMEIVKLASVVTLEKVGARFGMHKQSIHRIVKRWQNWAQPLGGRHGQELTEDKWTRRKPALPTIVTLKSADCIIAMKELPPECIDVVTTSPPYNRGKNYDTYFDRMNAVQYLRFMDRWTDQVHRILKPDGSFCLNLAGSMADPYMPFEVLARLRHHFILQNTFHWIKSITIQIPKGGAKILGTVPHNQPVTVRTETGETVTGKAIRSQEIQFNAKGSQVISVGHFSPHGSSIAVQDCHEYVFQLTKTGRTTLERKALGVPYVDRGNIKRRCDPNRRLRCRGNNWFVPYETVTSNKEDRPHPASFPVQLAVNCIKIHGIRPGMVVLDPFVGIGSSAEAAKACGVERFIGFDISATYLAEARKRVCL